MLNTTLVVSLALMMMGPDAGSVPAADQKAAKVEVRIEQTRSLEYLIALPEKYDADGEPVPLILFLHGAGERGSDLNRVKVHGPPKMIEQGHDFGAIVVSPQCPADSWWPAETDMLIAVLDAVVGELNVDEKRIYVTGLSMGGYGTFALAAEHSERFAAAVPICGGGTYFDARRLSRMAMWVFHGDADEVVPVDESVRMVRYMNELGGRNAKLTVYPGTGHDSWSEAYSDPELWKWLFEQSLR